MLIIYLAAILAAPTMDKILPEQDLKLNLNLDKLEIGFLLPNEFSWNTTTPGELIRQEESNQTQFAWLPFLLLGIVLNILSKTKTKTKTKLCKFWLPMSKLPSNAGSLTRTACTIGTEVIFGSPYFRQYDSFVKKAKKSAVQIPLSIFQNSYGVLKENTLSDLKKPGKWHFVFMDSPATMERYGKTSVSLRDLDLSEHQNYVFVFGNEKQGFDLFEPETYQLTGGNFVTDYFIKEFPGCSYSFCHIEQAYNGVGLRENHLLNLSVVAATTMTMAVAIMSDQFDNSLKYNLV